MIEAGLWGARGRVVADHRRAPRLRVRHVAGQARLHPRLRCRHAAGRGRLRADRGQPRGLGARDRGRASGSRSARSTFYVGSVLIDRMHGQRRLRRPTRAERPVPPVGGASARTKGLAVVLGAVLDGIPESVVLGLSLIGGAGIGVPVLVAVFVSNVPEALSASEDLSDVGCHRSADHRDLGDRRARQRPGVGARLRPARHRPVVLGRADPVVRRRRRSSRCSPSR